jgi:hypothetical protein
MAAFVLQFIHDTFGVNTDLEKIKLQEAKNLLQNEVTFITKDMQNSESHL